MSDSSTETATTGAAAPAGAGYRLSFSAVSDVGRYRKDNQDSGYAGAWLLAICDGVGGAARGDLASATAISQLRRLDERGRAPDPSVADNDLADGDLLGQIAGALHRGHDRIAELVDEDPALEGTSTTATVALFDGRRFGIGHIGDSRAYLLRGGEISQLTSDHTFVQTLIDEGRITEEDAKTHPHRNLILKALDGVHDTEPDLFHVEVVPGDRVLLCSDGASGPFGAERIGQLLGDGTPDFAAIELVRAALDAGSTDNVTAIIAEVVPADDAHAAELTPLLVGAAAELPRRPWSGAVTTTPGRGLFRGHRAGDTGELEPIKADLPDLPPDVYAIPSDPLDPEEMRYAPRPMPRYVWVRRLLAVALLGGLAWGAIAAGWAWSQTQYYVGESNGVVTVFRGLDADIVGFALSEPYETTDVAIDRLSDLDATTVREGIDATGLDDAHETVIALSQRQSGAESAP